jgi:hypothetical protein
MKNKLYCMLKTVWMVREDTELDSKMKKKLKILTSTNPIPSDAFKMINSGNVMHVMHQIGAT